MFASIQRRTINRSGPAQIYKPICYASIFTYNRIIIGARGSHKPFIFPDNQTLNSCRDKHTFKTSLSHRDISITNYKHLVSQPRYFSERIVC